MYRKGVQTKQMWCLSSKWYVTMKPSECDTESDYYQLLIAEYDVIL